MEAGPVVVWSEALDERGTADSILASRGTAKPAEHKDDVSSESNNTPSHTKNPTDSFHSNGCDHKGICQSKQKEIPGRWVRLGLDLYPL